MMIRLMTEADAGPVAAVLNHAIETGVAHFGLTPTSIEEVRGDWEASREYYPWLVACADDGAFLGFAKAGEWKSRRAYQWTVEAGIYIVEGAQGRGVGRALYARLFEALALQGYRVVLGGVSVPNPGSEKLHEGMGMTIAGEIAPAGYKLGRWVPVRYYQKLLAPCAPNDAPQPVCPVAQAWDRLGEPNR